MEIWQNRLDRPFRMFQDEIEEAAIRTLRSGWYVLGKEVASFENEFASYLGAEYCVGLASGLDALWITFRILGIGSGDEVIVQANTYIASVMGITINGAIPVFVEPNEFHNLDPSKIEAAITPKTKAILAVHLYGQPCDMESICAVAENHGLFVVEDCAQSHGSSQNGKYTGTFGDVGCFSFYPSKNLGAFGDAGAVVVKTREIAEKFKTFRNYGSSKRYYNEVVGTNSRLDEIQAAMLRVKLSHIADINAERARICERYLSEIKNKYIRLPSVRSGCTTVWHLFVALTDKRDKFAEYLRVHGIGSIIHYPIPPHLSEAYAYLGFKRGDFPISEEYADTCLSLPLYNGMTNDEQSYVIGVINDYEG